MIKRLKYKNLILLALIAGCFFLFLFGRYCNSFYYSSKDADFWVTQLNEENNSIRMGAVRILGRLGDKKVVPYLSYLLMRDNNLWVRVESAVALGNIRDAAALDSLLFALKSNNPPVRREAAAALGKIGDPRAVEDLISRLRKDNNHLVRIRIIEALGLLNDKQAIKAISAYLEDRDIWVRRVSYQALRRLEDN